MPLVTLLHVCVRRWYVVLLGGALTLGALYAVHERPGVYWSRVQLVLVAPPQAYYPNTIASPPFSLAPMASILVSDWNGTDKPLLTSSAETTLYGEGVRRGTQVRLPNEGSQFQPLFTAPDVDVQVVGPSEAEVSAETARVLDELRQNLQRRQDQAGVPERMRITTLTTPEVVETFYVTGRSSRALAATLLIGAVGTGFLTVGADRALGRLGSRRRRSQLAPVGTPA